VYVLAVAASYLTTDSGFRGGGFRSRFLWAPPTSEYCFSPFFVRKRVSMTFPVSIRRFSARFTLLMWMSVAFSRSILSPIAVKSRTVRLFNRVSVASITR